MAYNYVVTAQKPTNVTHSLTGAFTGPNDINLILIKSTRLEVHLMGPEGLIPVLDVRIYGRVSTAQMLRLANEQQDVLFISTERYQFAVLAYDAATGELKTRSNGSLKESIGKPVDNGHIGTADPQSRMIGLNLYEGQFRVIPFSPQGRTLEPFSVRLEETSIIDIKFLDGCSRPTIAVLYVDQRSARHVKTYVINAREREASTGPWSQTNVERGSNHLIPVPAPLGGVLIVGAQTLTYHNGSSYKAIPIHTTCMAAYGRVDENGGRWLLGDTQGQLFLLALNNDGRQVQSLHLEVLGETSCASSISYLDSGMVFIGSSGGDSQLIRLSTERDENGSYVKVEASYLNLGPILDMCLLDLERQGQGQLVTCSGTYKDGSLRVIRNGIGINEQAAIELPGIKGMWSLRASFNADHDKYLVKSFISETRVLGIEGEEMEEVQLPGFISGKTLHCGNMTSDLILQVTETCARLISCNGLAAVNEWSVPQGSRITVAAANDTQVVLALTGGEVVHLELNAVQRALELKARTQLEHEVSCLSVHPLEPHAADKVAGGTGAVPMDTGDTPTHTHTHTRRGSQRGSSSASAANGHTHTHAHTHTHTPSSNLVAVGMWNDMTVRLLSLPTLQPVVRCELGGDVQARSVLLVSLEATDYLLVALGDGHLISFTLDKEDQQPTGDDQAPAISLGPRKKVSLGTQPITLTPFASQGSTCVFAASDRPTVVYSSGSKLLFSNVNIPEVTLMTPFHSELFPECLALASESGLLIGTVDEIQKLQIQTVPLGESPRRIAHNAQGRVFAVCTAKYVVGETGDEEHNWVRFLDDATFEAVGQFELRPFEMAVSIVSCTLSKDPRELIIVGTAMSLDDEDEPKEGRLLVFHVTMDANGVREVNLVSEKGTKGAVYCLHAFNGKLLAGINSKVQLYKWADKDGTPELQTEVGHHGHVLVLYMQSRGDFIIVGDLMRSVSLLVYKSVESTIEEIAKDYSPHWMTAVDMIDDDVFIGAEHAYNIFTVRKNAEAATDEDRYRLETVGEFHLGEFVNKFVKGSLVMQPAEADASGSATDSMAIETHAHTDAHTHTHTHTTPTRLHASAQMDTSVTPAAAGAAAEEGTKSGADAVTGKSASPAASSLLFCTVNGMIGVVAPISEDDYRFFLCLQKAVSKVVKGVGGFAHDDWRRFTTEQRTSDAHAFIDGDLVESFLDLPRQRMEEVVKMMQADGWTAPAAADRAEGNMEVAGGAKAGPAAGDVQLTVEDVYKRVEDMSRIH